MLRVITGQRFRYLVVILVTVGVVGLFAGSMPAGERTAQEDKVKYGQKRLGFYLHGCWKYNYPFAVRSWKKDDYHNMFQLLKQLGFNTVMLWPALEAVPMPLSEEDREAVRGFRPIIEDAQKCGLETWLTLCIVTSQAEIAAKPWMERSLYYYMKTVWLNNPEEAKAYLKHRAALLEILNNADGYVTIDGDPGGYPGATPDKYLMVLLNDRKVIDRVGTHHKTQRIIPWVWAGWGTKGVWQEPIEPFVRATLKALKQKMVEPWEMLPGRSYREGRANGRINFAFAKEEGLLDRSTLMCYESIEFEPIPPLGRLQFENIRKVLLQEMKESAGARGWFGNAQQPIMVLPNLYLFARGTADPSYLAKSDEEVLCDLAELLGGPRKLLVPAWMCLRLKLEEIPTDLPAKLRAAKLSGEAAAYIPGGAKRYLEILAAETDSQIRLLRACAKKAHSPEEAARVITEGTGALVDWWKLHRYVRMGKGDEPFQWNFGTRYPILQRWCAQNVSNPKIVREMAAQEIVRRGILTEKVARERVSELLKR